MLLSSFGDLRARRSSRVVQKKEGSTRPMRSHLNPPLIRELTIQEIPLAVVWIKILFTSIIY